MSSPKVKCFDWHAWPRKPELIDLARTRFVRLNMDHIDTPKLIRTSHIHLLSAAQQNSQIWMSVVLIRPLRTSGYLMIYAPGRPRRR